MLEWSLLRIETEINTIFKLEFGYGSNQCLVDSVVLLLIFDDEAQQTLERLYP